MNDLETLIQSRDAVKLSVLKAEKDLAEKKTVLATLEQGIAILSGQGGVMPLSSNKAPAGALKTAVLGLFEKGKTMTAKEAIAALKQNGYPHSLYPKHVRNAIRELFHSDKKLTRSGKKPRYVYSLRK